MAPRKGGHPPSPAERAKVIEGIPTEKRSKANIAFVEAVVCRLKPVDHPLGRAVYFSPDEDQPGRWHLDEDAVVDAPTKRCPSAKAMTIKRGRLMMPDPSLPRGADGKIKRVTLVNKLYNIYCDVGSEWRPRQGRGREAVCHIYQYPPTPEDLAAGETVGPTCTCGNWTHVVVSTENQRHRAEYENGGGQKPRFGEDNPNTPSANSAVDAMRNEVWALATKGKAYVPLETRVKWKPGSKEFAPLRVWVHEHQSVLQTYATMLGVGRRTIKNYLYNATFPKGHPAKKRREFDLTPHALCPRRRIREHEERNATFIRNTVERHLQRPRWIASFEETVGAPEDGAPNVNLYDSILRTLRRTLNKRHGRSARTRQRWIKASNYCGIRDVDLPSIMHEVNAKVRRWLAERRGEARYADVTPEGRLWRGLDGEAQEGQLWWEWETASSEWQTHEVYY